MRRGHGRADSHGGCAPLALPFHKGFVTGCLFHGMTEAAGASPRPTAGGRLTSRPFAFPLGEGGPPNIPLAQPSPWGEGGPPQAVDEASVCLHRHPEGQPRSRRRFSPPPSLCSGSTTLRFAQDDTTLRRAGDKSRRSFRCAPVGAAREPPLQNASQTPQHFRRKYFIHRKVDIIGAADFTLPQAGHHREAQRRPTARCARRLGIEKTHILLYNVPMNPSRRF